MTTSKFQSLTFEQMFISLLGKQYDVRTVFNDFLTAALCTLSMDAGTMRSHYEDDYLKAIEPYKANNDARHFPMLYAKLIVEMDAQAKTAPDVVGRFFEAHIASDRKAQFFTPWSICLLMAKLHCAGLSYDEQYEERRILDCCCGSGRTLLAGSREFGQFNSYYGIDIDPLCVKMATLNLFLNGVFKGEILCADTLNPHDSFQESYILSRKPLRVYKITEKEQSPLWRSQVESFGKERSKNEDMELVRQVFNSGNGGQLSFF